MNNQIKKLNSGFTLIEVILSVAIFVIVGIGITALANSIFSHNRVTGTQSADADQARKASFKLMQELRNASSSNTGGHAVGEASNQQLTFYSNVDGGTDVERLRYYISNGKLYRGLLKPTGSPLTYNAANETSVVVQNNVVNGANPLFYYYNGNYTGTEAALTQPVNITQVKLVKLDLQIDRNASRTGSQAYSVTSSGAIRSLKTNLGE